MSKNRMTFFKRRSRLKTILMALCLAFAVGQTALGAGVVFRYLPGDASLSSNVASTGVSVAPFLDPAQLTARGPGGWGLTPPQAALFDGVSATMQSAADDDLRQIIGPQITVEAWVRPARATGRMTLVGNQVGEADGFTLGIDGGRPFFRMVFLDQTLVVEATEALALGDNYWIAATAKRSGATVTLSLYIDGHLQSEHVYTPTLSPLYPIARPFYVGTTALGDAAAPRLTPSYAGHLFAAIVRDYVPRDLYFTSSVPKDGSRYFGLPAFYDYDLETTHVPMDERISEAPLDLKHRFFLPFVNDNFVPQGVASHFEVNGTDTTALVYLGYYHMTRSGKAEGMPSVLAEVDAKTGHLRRGFRLTGGQISSSHAGGLAYAHGAIYVSSRGWLERYPLPVYSPDGPLYQDLPADPSGTMLTSSKASYVSAFKDTLWVGDWRTASDVAPYLYGYPLGADGKINTTARPVVYALPRNVQGVDLFEYDGQTYVFMSRNRNSREAEADAVPPVRSQSLRRPHARHDRHAPVRHRGPHVLAGRNAVDELRVRGGLLPARCRVVVLLSLCLRRLGGGPHSPVSHDSGRGASQRGGAPGTRHLSAAFRGVPHGYLYGAGCRTSAPDAGGRARAHGGEFARRHGVRRLAYAPLERRGAFAWRLLHHRRERRIECRAVRRAPVALQSIPVHALSGPSIEDTTRAVHSGNRSGDDFFAGHPL